MMYVVLVPAWLWVALQAGMILSAGVATFAAMVVVRQSRRSRSKPTVYPQGWARRRPVADEDKAPGPIEP